MRFRFSGCADRSDKGRHVHFADLISVRPIQATGKGKPTPPRGKSVVSAVWQSSDVSIDFVGVEREPDILAWVDRPILTLRTSGVFTHRQIWPCLHKTL